MQNDEVTRTRTRAEPPGGDDDGRAPASSEGTSESVSQTANDPLSSGSPFAAVVVVVSLVAIVAAALFYLIRTEPIVIQGEADATRIDIAARVDGRVSERPVDRADDVGASQVLFRIENPQLLTKLKEAEAARDVAAADLKRIRVGTRAEVVEDRRAAVVAAEASVKLAQQTFDRVSQLAAKDFATGQRLDETTQSLAVAQQALARAQLAYQEAIAGYTKEERGVAEANVGKAEAAIATLKAQADELVVKAPVAAQVYQIAAEVGEYVAPGVPLLSLVDLSDVWLRFALREDLARGLAVGHRITVVVPALGDRAVDVEIRTIATRGEYAGWRATRATGDFDLRTFEVRAYPLAPVPGLRPGMSAYVQWKPVP